MIEDRLGEAAFLDFIRGAGREVLAAASCTAADLQRELEAYTGRDWGEFFDHWLYGKGLTDWAVENGDGR